MTTAQMAHAARKHMQLIAQLRTAHGISEIEGRWLSGEGAEG